MIVRTSTTQLIASTILLALGFYFLEDGLFNKSTGDTASLVGGAVCFALGMMAFAGATKSFLWYRRTASRLRRS